MSEVFIQHCIATYEALDAVSIDKKLESGETARIFAGKYSEVWASTGIAQTYYSPVRRSLIKHGAIHVLQRGGRSTDTVIALLGLPKAWKVEGWLDKGDLTNAADYATLSAAIRELATNQGGINIPKALIEIEKRLVSVEKDIGELLKRTKVTDA